MTDIRMRIADEIAGIVVGEGYYSTTIGITAALEAADALIAAGVVAEEPEWEYGVKFDWKPEPSYVGSYENCRYFMDQPNDSLEKHAYPDDTKTLLRRRKAGPWAPVKQEGADQCDAPEEYGHLPSEPQGEPSDAQTEAACGAFYNDPSDLTQWSRLVEFEGRIADKYRARMRAALRAAGGAR